MSLIWWRDDDAGPDVPQLARLLALAAAFEIPLALAVVPAWIEQAAARRIRRAIGTHVLQHGWCHANHARAGERKIELGGSVERERLFPDLVRGRRSLEARFRDRFLPVMVPPWNRIDRDVEQALPQHGYRAVSTFRTRRAPAVPGLPRLDTHLDLVDWRARRVLPLELLLHRLQALRAENPAGPIGILTHHRIMDEGAFAILEGLLRALVEDPDLRWCSVDQALGESR